MVPIPQELSWLAFLVSTVGWIGTGVMWFLDREHKRRQIVDLSGRLLERVQAARTAYGEACQACTSAANALLRGLTDDAPAEDLDELREAFCAAVIERALPSYLCYVEVLALDARTEQNAAEEVEGLITDDLVPELERFASWIRLLNYPELFEQLPHRSSPAFVNKRNLLPFRRIARQVRSGRHELFYRKIDAAIEQIVEAGRRQPPAAA